MHFKKQPLALAVFSALALSPYSHADIEYTGNQSSIEHIVTSDIPVGIVIHDATVGTLDIDVQKDRWINDSVIITDSTISQAYIENNGGNIKAIYDANVNAANKGIYISGSTITGYLNTSGQREFITNTGDILAALNNPSLGGAIHIEDSTIHGSIINEDYNNDTVGAIEGVESGIAIWDSTFNGSIYNEDDLADTSTPPNLNSDPVAGIVSDDYGVDILRSTFNGSIINSGLIESNEAINIEESTFTGDINNSGHIIGTSKGIHMIGTYENSALTQKGTYTGDIDNSGFITAGNKAININGMNFQGDITNSGTIKGNRGINLYETSYTGTISNSGTIEADASDTNARGISVNTTSFDGSINNSGDISGYRAVSITNDVTGQLTFNQLAGSLTGNQQAVVLFDHRFNYMGGNINGKFSNLGGTLYVEGHKAINGNYYQDADATLALGFHTASSLTADNINLTSGSKVLLDLSKGDLYLQDGDSVELLKVNSGGTITASGVQFEVDSTLASVGAVTTNSSGNLVITIERDSFVEAVNQLTSSGSVSGQTGTNLNSVATVLQQLDGLAAGSSEITALLNKVETDNIESLLPDASGAATDSATTASTSAGGVVSTRTRSVASGDTFNKSGMWVQGLYADVDKDTKNGVSGFDSETGGIIVGVDGETQNGTVYGVAYTYAETDSDTKGSQSRVDTDYYQLTGYWGYSMGSILMDGQLYYGLGKNNASRSGVGGTALADFDTKQYGIQMSSGYQFITENEFLITPRASFEYGKVKTDTYSETGTAAGLLNVSAQNLEKLELGLAIEASKTFQSSNLLVTPRVSLAAFHDFKAETTTLNSAFQSASDINFMTQGAEAEKTRYLASLSTEFAKGDNFTALVEYNYNWRSDLKAHSGAIKLRWDF